MESINISSFMEDVEWKKVPKYKIVEILVSEHILVDVVLVKTYKILVCAY